MAHPFTVLRMVLILYSMKPGRSKNISKGKKEKGQLKLATDCQSKLVLRSQTAKDRNQQNPHTDQVLEYFLD
jgi:hypothetical protein